MSKHFLKEWKKSFLTWHQASNHRRKWSLTDIKYFLAPKIKTKYHNNRSLKDVGKHLVMHMVDTGSLLLSEEITN